MANHRYRYQMTLRRAAVSMQLWGVADGQPDGANGGFLMAGQEYSPEDCVAVMSWLTERANHYPISSMLWGVGRWPNETQWHVCAACEGGVGQHNNNWSAAERHRRLPPGR